MEILLDGMESFIWWLESDEKWLWPSELFSMLKTTFCNIEHKLKSKLAWPIRMKYKLKEYVKNEDFIGLKYGNCYSKKTWEGVHLIVNLSAISLQACKVTKNELLHTYFSRILLEVIYCAFSRNQSWKGASCFDGEVCFSDGGASFLSGGCTSWGFFKKGCRMGGEQPMPPPPLWETLPPPPPPHTHTHTK